MKKQELHKLYKDCLFVYGAKRQMRMLQEECAELIVAVSHYLRPDRKDDKETIDNLIEELADVYLMRNQVTLFIGEQQVMKMVDVKSDKIKEKLEQYIKELKNGI